MNKVKAVGIIVVATVALVVIPSATASADVVKDATQACGGTTPFSFVQYVTEGERYVLPPGSSDMYINSGSATSYYHGTKEGLSGGGYWWVRATVDMQTLNTYAFCSRAG